MIVKLEYRDPATSNSIYFNLIDEKELLSLRIGFIGRHGAVELDPPPAEVAEAMHALLGQYISKKKEADRR